MGKICARREVCAARYRKEVVLRKRRKGCRRRVVGCEGAVKEDDRWLSLARSGKRMGSIARFVTWVLSELIYRSSSHPLGPIFFFFC
jgi:hypothetical protein